MTTQSDSRMADNTSRSEVKCPNEPYIFNQVMIVSIVGLLLITCQLLMSITGTVIAFQIKPWKKFEVRLKQISKLFWSNLSKLRFEFELRTIGSVRCACRVVVVVKSQSIVTQARPQQQQRQNRPHLRTSRKSWPKVKRKLFIIIIRTFQHEVFSQLFVHSGAKEQFSVKNHDQLSTNNVNHIIRLTRRKKSLAPDCTKLWRDIDYVT